MTEFSNKILEKYQVRKTYRQKTEFIELLKNEFKDKQITVESQGRFIRSRNIVVGDIEKAKFVAGAHYDTQPVMPFPNFLSPKNYLRYIIFSLFVFVFFAVVFTAMNIAIIRLIPTDFIKAILPFLNVFLVISIIFFGPANKHTANDNTSGIITLLEAINSEGCEDIAFVFFDLEETGLWGSRRFSKLHQDVMKNKLLINFDCVSDGDHIMLVLNKKARAEWGEKTETAFTDCDDKQVFITKAENTVYPSDQANFKCSIGVAAFKKSKFIGYYMNRIHTPKDTVFDERNIYFLVDGLKKLARQ